MKKGIFYMVMASLFFACMGGFAKLIGKAYSPLHITFFRNAIGLLPILFSLYQNPPKKENPKPFLLAFRGIIGTFALFTLFYNLATIPLAEAVTYIQASPIFIAIFSYFYLKERLSFLGWMAVFIGFIGVIFITRPEGSLETVRISGVVSSILTALAYTSVRELKKHYDTRIIVLSFLFWGSFLPVLIFYSPLSNLPGVNIVSFSMPPFRWQDMSLLVLIGLSALGGQLYITRAYGEANAAILGVIGYSNILFAIVIGVILGDKLPGQYEGIGMTMVIISGILITREKVV